MSELKNCPFCGGEAQLMRYINFTFTVACSKCGIQIVDGKDTEEEAIKTWNRRVDEDTNKA